MKGMSNDYNNLHCRFRFDYTGECGTYSLTYVGIDVQAVQKPFYYTALNAGPWKLLRAGMAGLRMFSRIWPGNLLRWWLSMDRFGRCI